MIYVSNLKEKLRRFFAVGVIPLIVVLVIWLLPTFVIASIDERINLLELRDNLTKPEQKMFTDLQWSKVWWITTKGTVFNPIAMILLTVILTIYIVQIAYLLLTRFT